MFFIACPVNSENNHAFRTETRWDAAGAAKFFQGPPAIIAERTLIT